jgi:hypothetical protein
MRIRFALTAMQHLWVVARRCKLGRQGVSRHNTIQRSHRRVVRLQRSVIRRAAPSSS